MRSRLPTDDQMQQLSTGSTALTTGAGTLAQGMDFVQRFLVWKSVRFDRCENANLISRVLNILFLRNSGAVIQSVVIAWITDCCGELRMRSKLVLPFLLEGVAQPRTAGAN